MKVGEKIQELRTNYRDPKGKTGMSQGTLAKQLGVGRLVVLAWEKGKYRPSEENVSLLANLFKKEPGYFRDDPVDPSQLVMDQLLPAAFPVSLRVKIMNEAARRQLDFDTTVVVLLAEYFSQRFYQTDMVADRGPSTGPVHGDVTLRVPKIEHGERSQADAAAKKKRHQK